MHELEILNGEAQMAYVGELPWHGLGVRVPADLTPTQMLEAAGLDWTVEKIPAYANIAGNQVDVGRSALVRNSDNKILDIVSNDWNPCQNSEAFEFFNDFVEAGDMEMHTAGSLKGGKIVWALAKVGESFELFGKDKVESFLLFSNPHSYGQSIDVRTTNIRVVCNNTLTLSLGSNSQNMVKVSHRAQFDPDQVKEALGVAKHKLAQYKEMAQFLSQKRFTDETIVEYFQRVFPVLTQKEEARKELSKSATKALEVLHTQPGAEFGEGTFWQAFNAVTYMQDHIIGRSVDSRLTSSWYGAGKNLKIRALELATDMANVS
jgi:phage/plasmid-like protein (TIGR03299 family)